jgi:hypothetical protein
MKVFNLIRRYPLFCFCKISGLLKRGVAFDGIGLIREVAIGGIGLIRRGSL